MSIVGTMAVTLMTTGGNLSSRFYHNQDSQKDARIAMSWITMRLRQNDTTGGFTVEANSDNKIVDILKEDNSILYKLTFDTGRKVLKEDSFKDANSQDIANLNNVVFEDVGDIHRSLRVTITDNSGKEMESTVSLRSD